MSTSSTDLSTLKKLIALCKKSGVQSVKMGQIEVSFLPYSQKTKAIKGKDSNHIPTEGMFSDDDILNWSVPGVGAMHG